MYVPVDQRVWQRLVELADTYSEPGDSASGAVIPLTQEDIAQLAGTTRPTVNRLLRNAESDGHVRMARARLEVLDVDALRTRARRG
jgi:CRP-like cAMP-binding protein